MVEIKIDIPQYNRKEGLKPVWEDGFEINVRIEEDDVVISANKAGLVSLARQLLTLAQEEVLSGSHFHYDEYNSLQEGSTQMIIEKSI